MFNFMIKLIIFLFIVLTCFSFFLYAKNKKEIRNNTSEDEWMVFPASRSNKQAWVSFNKTFSNIAKLDKRYICSHFIVNLKKPNKYGMPIGSEYDSLNKLDELLYNFFTSNGGIYVGRVTVAGTRHLFYYSQLKEPEISNKTAGIFDSLHYKYKLKVKEDKNKNEYWNNLYPTEPEWQVIRDLSVLDVLKKNKDNPNIKRKVNHWAYFKTKKHVNIFKLWLLQEKYILETVKEIEGGNKYQVCFFHNGTMNLNDITSHTISLNAKAKEIGGNYDGWETSVER